MLLTLELIILLALFAFVLTKVFMHAIEKEVERGRKVSKW